MSDATANSLQQSILNAVDTIVSRRVKDADYDKTIIGTINSFLGIKNKRYTYKVNYNGGVFNAVVLNDNDSYPKNTPVYIFVPRGNFSQEKIILGRASDVNVNTKLDIENVILNNFTTIGKNNLDWISDKESAGLRSYHAITEEEQNPPSITHRMQTIYKKDSSNNYIKVDSFSNLNRYVNEGSAIMIRADFRTNLSLEQKQQATGRYGLAFKLNFNNENANWGNTQQGEILNNICEKNIIKATTEFGKDQSLIDYVNQTTDLIDSLTDENYAQQITNSDSVLTQLIAKIEALYNTFLANSSVNIPDIVNETISAFLTELNSYLNFDSGNAVKQSFQEWNEKEINVEEVRSTILQLTSDTMIGAPLYFKNWTSQYAIFSIEDLANFKEIEQVVFFKDGFIQNKNKEQEDIFVKNIGFYILKSLDSVSGDYSLKVESAETGSILSQSTDQVIFKASFYRKLEDLSQSLKLTYYWFKEDPSVTIGSTYYNEYGRKGWKLLADAKRNSKYFTTTYDENTAQKNLYKCVAVFSEGDESVIVITAPFIVYNIEFGNLIELTSDVGTVFQFGLGSPVITCFVNGQELTELDDNKLKFYWSLIRNDNEEIPFYEQSNLDWENLSAEDFIVSYQGQDQYFNGVVFYKGNEITENVLEATKLQYPMKNLSSDEIVTIKCSVMKEIEEEEILLGSREIKFENRGGAVLNGYHIEFENDGQVFQYDEYGNSPKLNSKIDSFDILPLRAKLIAPSGLEVSGTNVRIDWIFNLYNSMIIPPENLTVNSATNEINVLRNSITCNFDISDLYDPDSINNQITCHIVFNGEDYYKQTNLLFRKIGENGSNGTNILTQINPISQSPILDNQALTLYTFSEDSEIKGFLNDAYYTEISQAQTNVQLTGLDETGLEINVYQKGSLLNSDQYISRWNLAGNTSETNISKAKNFKLSREGDTYNYNLIWDSTVNNNQNYHLQIIKSHIIKNDDKTEYYGYYPLPIIHYVNKTDISALASNRLAIDKDYYLKEITYNADGRNPIYNHNQGLKLINLPSNTSKITWIAKGGWDSNENTPSFSLISEKDSNEKGINNVTSNIEDVSEEMIYIIPNDAFSGSATNNRIEVILYDNKEQIIAIISAPIIFTLDTFGLASLNAWDGNTLTIDEEGGYIVAPQIGAGEKDPNNRFTGIVMGKTETYTGGAKNEKQIGLFGYSDGLQSIFLDAETGDATFGLPDVEDGHYINSNREASDNYQEGRIELRPGGESVIGGWRLGRKSLYYTDDGTLGNRNGYPDPDYILTREGTIEKDTSNPYSAHHDKDIAHDKGGILLYGGQNPYISIKSKPLTEDEVSSSDDSLLRAKDSLELQLDPNTPTLFTIFRHNGSLRKKNENDSSEDEENILYKPDTRTFLAGINSKGEFVANSITNKSTTYLPTPEGGTENEVSDIASKFYFNTLAAFNDTKERPYHIGFQMEANKKVLGQFFASLLDLSDTTDEIPTLYISGGNNEKETDEGWKWGEYLKNLSLHGRQISLFVPDRTEGSLRAANTTDSNIIINQNQGQIQIKKDDLFLLSNNENSKLATTQDFDTTIGKYVPTEYEEVYLIVDEETGYKIPLSRFGTNRFFKLKDYNDEDFYVWTYMRNEIEENQQFYLLDIIINEETEETEIEAFLIDPEKIYYKINRNNVEYTISNEVYNTNYYQYLDEENNEKYIQKDFFLENLYDNIEDKNKISYDEIGPNSCFAVEKENASKYFNNDENQNWYIDEKYIGDEINTQYNIQSDGQHYLKNIDNENIVFIPIANDFDFTNFNWYKKITRTVEGEEQDFYYQLTKEQAYYHYIRTQSEIDNNYPEYIPIAAYDENDENTVFYKQETLHTVSQDSLKEGYYIKESNQQVYSRDETGEEIIVFDTTEPGRDNDSVFTAIYENDKWIPKYPEVFIEEDYTIVETIEYHAMTNDEKEDDSIEKYISYVPFGNTESIYIRINNLEKDLNNKLIIYYQVDNENYFSENDFNGNYYRHNEFYYSKDNFEMDLDNDNPVLYVYVQNKTSLEEFLYIKLKDFKQFSAKSLTEEIFGKTYIYLKDIDLENKYSYIPNDQVYIENEEGNYYKTSLLTINIFFDFYLVSSIRKNEEGYLNYIYLRQNDIYLEKTSQDKPYYLWIKTEDEAGLETELTVDNQYLLITDVNGHQHYTSEKQWNNKEEYARDDNGYDYLINENTLVTELVSESFPDKTFNIKAKKMSLEIGSGTDIESTESTKKRYYFNSTIYNQENTNAIPHIKIQNYNMPINIFSYEKQFDFRIFEGSSQIGWIAINPNLDSAIVKKKDSSDIIGAFVSAGNVNSLANNGLIITRDSTYLEHSNNLKLRANQTTSMIMNTTGVGNGYKISYPQILLQAGTSGRYAKLILNSSNSGWNGYTNGTNYLNYPLFAISTSYKPNGAIGVYPQNINGLYSELFYVPVDQTNKGAIRIDGWGKLIANGQTLSSKFGNYYTKSEVEALIEGVKKAIPDLSGYATQTWVNNNNNLAKANHNHDSRYSKKNHNHAIKYTTTTVDIGGGKSRRVVQTVGNGGSETGYTSTTYNK